MDKFDELLAYYGELKDREIALGINTNTYTDEFEEDGFKYIFTYVNENNYEFNLVEWPINIEELIVPDIVTMISGNLCNLNKTLRKVVLGRHCKKIGGKAFRNCVNLTEINGEHIEVIGRQAFEYCKSLEKFDFGENLNAIYEKSFMHTALKTVKFHSKLKAMKVACFSYCENLRSVEDLWCLEEENLDGTVGACDRVFFGCRKLENVSIIEMSRIPSEFFWYCDSLKNIKVKKSIGTEIGVDAFYRCRSDLVIN